jgi:cytochrome b
MRIRVWDLPLRAFHWLLALAVGVAFVAAQIGGNAMVWHGRAGLAVIGLLVFRIVWGFVGTTHARFASFVRGPAAIRAYLAGRWQGIGHNPLGALSVLALLGLLGSQAATGLFANDDIAYQGYLYALVGADRSARLTGIHKFFQPLLIALVLLHVGAIGYYTRVKKANLLRPMITGWTEATEASAIGPRGGGVAAFFFAASLAGLSVYLASGAPLRPPPPPAPAETPAW